MIIGQLGKRTRFQQHDTAQLVLDVTMETEDNTITVNDGDKYFPKARLFIRRSCDYHLYYQDISLNDDTVLNKINFVVSTGKAIPTLNCLQQAVIIALW